MTHSVNNCHKIATNFVNNHRNIFIAIFATIAYVTLFYEFCDGNVSDPITKFSEGIPKPFQYSPFAKPEDEELGGWFSDRRFLNFSRLIKWETRKNEQRALSPLCDVAVAAVEVAASLIAILGVSKYEFRIMHYNWSMTKNYFLPIVIPILRYITDSK